MSRKFSENYDSKRTNNKSDICDSVGDRNGRAIVIKYNLVEIVGVLLVDIVVRAVIR